MGCCTSDMGYPGPASDHPADYAADSDYMIAFEELVAAFPQAAGDHADDGDCVSSGDPMKDEPGPIAIQLDPQAGRRLKGRKPRCTEPSRKACKKRERAALEQLRERNRPIAETFGDDLSAVFQLRDPNEGIFFRPQQRERVWKWLRDIDLSEVAALCGIDSSGENDELMAALRSEIGRRRAALDVVSRASRGTRESSASTPGILYRQGLERMIVAAGAMPISARDHSSLDT